MTKKLAKWPRDIVPVYREQISEGAVWTVDVDSAGVPRIAEVVNRGFSILSLENMYIGYNVCIP